MRRSIAAVLVFMLFGAIVGGPGADRVAAEGNDAITSFDLRVLVDGSAITLEPITSAAWSTTYDLGAGSSGMFYVVEAGVGPRAEDLPSSDYCFSVQLVDGRIEMRSVRGTTWSALSYTCAPSGPCEFTVSERGVNIER